MEDYDYFQEYSEIADENSKIELSTMNCSQIRKILDNIDTSKYYSNLLLIIKLYDRVNDYEYIETGETKITNTYIYDVDHWIYLVTKEIKQEDISHNGMLVNLDKLKYYKTKFNHTDSVIKQHNFEAFIVQFDDSICNLLDK